VLDLIMCSLSMMLVLVICCLFLFCVLELVLDGVRWSCSFFLYCCFFLCP
jgi:hypothetical protein